MNNNENNNEIVDNSQNTNNENTENAGNIENGENIETGGNTETGENTEIGEGNEAIEGEETSTEVKVEFKGWEQFGHSFKYMGLGMLGIFIVTSILILTITALNKLHNKDKE